MLVGSEAQQGQSRVKFTDEEGEEVPLYIDKGEKREVEGVYYGGRTKANIVGVWGEGFKEPGFAWG
jgi:hypothetical protein